MKRPASTLALLALPALLALGASEAAAVASGWQVNPQSQVRLVSPYRVAAPGELVLGLEMRVAPGWHVYWKNSGDAGFPPSLDFSASPEITRSELLYPAPERYELPGDLVAFGYEDEVIYPVIAQLALPGPAAAVALVADLDYLVCEIDCIPYRYRLELAQPVADEPVADPDDAARIERWRRRVPRPVAEVAGVESRARLLLGSDDEASSPLLEVTVTGTAAAPGATPELFLESQELFDVGRPELVTAGGAPSNETDLRFRVPLAWRAASDRPPTAVELAWTVTGLAPAGEAGPLAISERATVAPSAPGAESPAAAAGTGAGGGSRWSRAAVGALLLGLTPALLAFVLLLAAGPPAGRRRRASAAAAGAIAGTALLAAAALPFQAPALAAGLAVAHLLFALWLWGLVGPASAELPVGGAFAGGLGVAVSTLAWPLPPVAEVAGTALLGEGGAPAGAALLAAGLALPFVVVAVLRPGAALAGGTARRALGFLPLLGVVWLLYRLSRQTDAPVVAAVELALLGVALAIWLAAGARRARRRGAYLLWLAVALTAAAVAVWAGGGT